MSKKRRLSFRIADDEALVIASVDFWEGVRQLFLDMSIDEPDADHREEWLECARYIDHWVAKTSRQEEELVGADD